MSPQQGRELLFSGAVILLLLAGLPAPAPAASTAARHGAVALPGDDQIAAAPTHSDALKSRDEMLRLVAGILDLEVMARYAAGPFWEQMVEPERSRYSELLATHLIELLRDLLPETLDQVETEKWTARTVGTDTLVSGSVALHGRPMQVGMMLRGTSPPRAIDFVFEFISIAKVLRAEVTSVARRAGVDFLLSELETRAEKRGGSPQRHSRGSSSLTTDLVP